MHAHVLVAITLSMYVVKGKQFGLLNCFAASHIFFLLTVICFNLPLILGSFSQ